ncbi:glucodextranase DOMON-like domain-containing protein [uncultured Jatrophihabitans sp.]|uniref:glucodextranase DOMON-like domain-containing protein n=1 Tax=uncultured Jatrophihabitans sp. TaxID=1610747 RepID=UPI0035CB8C2E
MPVVPVRRRALALFAAVVAVAGLVTVPTTAQATTAAAAPAAAPGGPGQLSRFDLARKDCVGTAHGTGSKVWFTVADGVLSDVYEPTIDNTNVQSMQYVVSDGRTFTDLQQRDTTYTVHADPSGMECTVVATSKAHGYRLTTSYLADPERDTVLVHTSVRSRAHLNVYVRLDAHVNGNGGGGSANGGADSGAVARGVPVVGDTGVVSQAVNRDYAVPTFMALDSPSLRSASVGYAGSASDGLTQLDATHRLSPTYANAPDGHVVATADVTPRGGRDITLGLGFGRTQSGARSTAAASLRDPYRRTAARYLRGWSRYDAGLRRPGRHVSRADLRSYYLSANVLKASEDKTFPGALVASLASPWGQAVSAGDLVGGKPVYFGSYREVFARDLYEGVTGFLADGDVASARAATRFLFERQQQPDGRMPRNSLLNGKVAPDTGGDQLDETAYPILMTYLTGLSRDRALYRDHVVPAANFLVAHGPSFGNERWEEQSGYSPSTIAAEIAGLTAAATIAKGFGDTDDLARARVYQATADQFQRTIKSQTVTTTGPYSPKPYFLRLTKDGDPNAATTYGLGNGSVTADQRSVVDGGFQELVRLGELPASDPDVVNSLAVLDKQLAKTTPSGTGYYRYGQDAKNGSVDGYGDCHVADPTDCPKEGQPWPTTDSGSGHLWPVLSGERAESALALGDTGLARSQLAFIRRSASGVGLVPEQAWENADVAADPYGSDPTTASIGFQDGHAAGSASPLTWAQAQQLRLIGDLGRGRIGDRPDITTQRYVRHGPPANVPTTITSPASGASASGTVTVTGTTAPGARVVVSSTATDSGGTTSFAATTAASTGAYSVSVPVGFGADVITATATTSTGTGYAQTSVVGDLVGGKTVLDTADPTGDDHGPGTYQYPTAGDFHDGAFDITRFQVVTKDSTVYLRTTLRDLTPTFGSSLGAQLLDVYVHQPTGTTSTAATASSRNYTIAPADAWTQRLEVQGFAAPVWVDASGGQVGSAAVVASQASKTITISVPQSVFGTPTSGWTFTLALTGQDGQGGQDQARTFAPTPQPYNFGVCAAGGTAAICSSDPNTVPKVMDTITPTGVSQATELDPTKGSVVLRGVPVP